MDPKGMFTSFDKALIALVMSVIFILNHFTKLHINIDESTLNSFIAILTPILVYLVPNKTSGETLPKA